MHENAGVGGRVALALGARGQQELSHGGRQAGGHGDDVVGDQLHGVVNGHARGDRATRGVDVQEDVRLGILGRQQQHLRADQVGVGVTHLGTEPDDAFLEQTVVDVIVLTVVRPVLHARSDRCGTVRLDGSGGHGMPLSSGRGRARREHGDP